MKMHSTTPLDFSNAPNFIEQYGDDIWGELCDVTSTGVIIDVAAVAHTMKTLAPWKNPERYLRQVLKNVKAENESAGNELPFEMFGKRLNKIMF